MSNQSACQPFLVNLAVFKDLLPSEREEIEIHLQKCAACRHKLADYEAMDRALRALPQPQTEPALRQRFIQQRERRPANSLISFASQLPVWAGQIAGFFLFVLLLATLWLAFSEPPATLPIPSPTPTSSESAVVAATVTPTVETPITATKTISPPPVESLPGHPPEEMRVTTIPDEPAITRQTITLTPQFSGRINMDPYTWSPDNRYLAYWEYDQDMGGPRSLRFFDLETLQRCPPSPILQQVAEEFRGYYTLHGWLGDGRMISVDGMQARLHPPCTSVVETLPYPLDRQIILIIPSPDGKTFLASDWQNYLLLTLTPDNNNFDVRYLPQLSLHQQHSFAWSPAGRYLAVSPAEGGALVYDLETMTIVNQISPEAWGRSYAFGWPDSGNMVWINELQFIARQQDNEDGPLLVTAGQGYQPLAPALFDLPAHADQVVDVTVSEPDHFIALLSQTEPHSEEVTERWLYDSVSSQHWPLGPETLETRPWETYVTQSGRWLTWTTEKEEGGFQLWRREIYPDSAPQLIYEGQGDRRSYWWQTAPDDRAVFLQGGESQSLQLIYPGVRHIEFVLEDYQGPYLARWLPDGRYLLLVAQHISSEASSLFLFPYMED